MFRQIFESMPLVYRTPAEWAGIPSGVGLGALYNGYLITPPRIYAEELSGIDGMFVAQEKTPTADAVIVLTGTTSRIYWPGWDRLWWKFNAITGEFMARGTNPASFFDYEVFQARDGSLWQKSSLGSFFQVDPISFDEVPGTRRGPDEFGALSIYVCMIDRLQNVAVLYTNNETGSRQIGVYNWTTGALIRRIHVGGIAIDILPEDERRCYVVTNSGLLCLVDYVSGEVLHTVRSPVPLGDVIYAWDRIYRRLLAFQIAPNGDDGACQSVIRGWYPVPLGTHLTRPLPLKAPRRGREVPVLVRVVGDAGEPIAGASVTLSVSDTASIVRHAAGSDAHGESVTVVHCNAPGSMTLGASATVEDGL
ncbi:hypothetical protein CF68_32995 [Cupriavidus sp. SK-4]|uniref:hypothetical protein n=1 Tax=Cupriavidus sp. SK-4 TaxID=574750 RepID=UPI00044EA71C|nr:hypothetical protein [Cupriavidus sp. SK-4]EYS89521.1 hypothetical protein CF68_32995 [Cupriavidus sp. SK-4]